MKQKIFLTLTLLVMTFGLCGYANAQKGKLFKGVDWKKAVEAAKSGRADLDQNSLAVVEEAYAAKKETANNFYGGPSLTGTWFMTVPGATPADTFYAYQTFGADGTFVETSSLLATLSEGPAHGVWEPFMHGYLLTFELFAFDPESRAPVGRIRVRNFLRLVNKNFVRVDSVVDFIEPDGTVIPNIAAGPYTGERVKIQQL